MNRGQNLISTLFAKRTKTLHSSLGDKGIVEMGSHEELMKKRGLYWQLYTAQVREKAA